MATKPQPVAKTDALGDELPTLVGVDEILGYCHELGIPVARWRVTRAVQTGTLPTHSRMVGNYACAVPRDVRSWLAGGAK